MGERTIIGGDERQDKGRHAARADDEKAGRDQMMLAEIPPPQPAKAAAPYRAAHWTDCN